MKHLRELCAAVTLLFVLTLSARAGEITIWGVAPPPPPPPPASATATEPSEITTWGTQSTDESHFIKLALKDAGGKITRAARLLRLKGHHSLNSLLKKHPDIPVKRRKQSIIPAGDIDIRRRTESGDRTVRILHVEDDKTIAGIVKEMLEDQGWQVETCEDGNAALEKISGEGGYDLLLVDYDLPGVNGLEFINRARELDHRCDTPMVVLSASPVEAAAREVGADVFLRKPQDVSSLVETINRLLEEREQDS